MKEILRIIGKALTDIAGVLPDRAAPDTQWKEAKKKIMSEIHSDTECVGCAVKPEPEAGMPIKGLETIGTDDMKVEVGALAMNECVETAPLYTDLPCSTTQTSEESRSVLTERGWVAGRDLTPSDKIVKAPPVQTAPTELDSEGIPWDKRIHSSGKTKYKQTVGDKKEGSWIHRKGVDPILLAQVKTELYTKYHTVEPVVDQFLETAPVPASLANTDAVSTSQPFTQPPVQQPGELSQPADGGGPIIPQTAPGELPPYGSITKWAPLMREAAGRGINHVAADGILAAAGLPTIAALQNTPSSIPAAALALGLTREI